jgi:hypothetical protein
MALQIVKAGDFTLMAEPDESDGLYTWDVTMGGFSPDSPLSQVDKQCPHSCSL